MFFRIMLVGKVFLCFLFVFVDFVVTLHFKWVLLLVGK